ncbi:MAG TPA: pyrimidine reductase family protein [Acidimicrobiales bacterium]|nr:pyrimidine reductase family protein [Acidimicrobiales bacterium]
MRALLPRAADDVDLVTAYALPPTLPERRPFVRCNMISSLDGAVTIAGRSGMLGGPGDRRVFAVLRSLADVVLVGAVTARAESYGPVRLDADLVGRRRAEGRPDVPPIAVVTRSCNFDWSAPFFTEATERPLVVTTEDAEPGGLARAAEVAQVVVSGRRQVDLGLALARLHESGHRTVLVEGGPGINAQLVRGGLVDELCLTLAPRLVAGRGPRILSGDELDRPLDLEVLHLLEEDDFLFYRLLVRR